MTGIDKTPSSGPPLKNLSTYGVEIGHHKAIEAASYSSQHENVVDGVDAMSGSYPDPASGQEAAMGSLENDPTCSTKPGKPEGPSH